MAIVLIGFMGAGKSTAARELGAVLGQQVLDSDELLAERFGHSVAEEFARSGEAAFRAAEEELVCELLERAGEGTLIALGGGSVLSARVQRGARWRGDRLPGAGCGDGVAARFAERRGAERPLAARPRRFERLHAERAPLYERLATR